MKRGSSLTPKLWIMHQNVVHGGRGALKLQRSQTARAGGAVSSADAEMSSDKGGEKPPRRKPKVSWVKLIFPGLAGT